MVTSLVLTISLGAANIECVKETGIERELINADMRFRPPLPEIGPHRPWPSLKMKVSHSLAYFISRKDFFLH